MVVASRVSCPASRSWWSRAAPGRALRTAWRASDAQLLDYMDVDLSTDLDALQPGTGDATPIVGLAAGGVPAPRGARGAVQATCRRVAATRRLGAGTTSVRGAVPGPGPGNLTIRNSGTAR
jgi:hypothetical protein